MVESIQGTQRMKLSVRAKRMYNLAYLLASVLLMLGFSAQFSSQQFSGLILVSNGYFCLSNVYTYRILLGINGTKIEHDFFVDSLQICGLLLSVCSIVSMALQAKGAAVISLGIAGSSIMFIGTLLNVLKSFKMQHNERVEATKVTGPTTCLKDFLIVEE